MHFLSHHYRSFFNSPFKERRLVLDGPETPGEIDPAEALEDLRSAVDRMRKPDPHERGAKHRGAAERARLYEEKIPDVNDIAETERREKAKTQIVRHINNASFHEYLDREHFEAKKIDATLKQIMDKSEEFYYSEIGNTVVIKQRPDSATAMPDAALPMAIDQNGAILSMGELKFDPRQWESWPKVPERMEEFEIVRLQMAVPAIARQYLNPSFTIYIEDELGQDWQTSPVIKGMEAIIENSNSDNLQYHMEGARMIILKRQPGGPPDSIPDDFYAAIDTHTGAVVQVGKQKLDPMKWDTWNVVAQKIYKINLAYRAEGRDLTPEEIRYREAYVFRLPSRFGNLIKLKKELNGEERKLYQSDTFVGTDGMYDRLEGRAPGPRNNDVMAFGAATRQLNIASSNLQSGVLLMWMSGNPAIAFTPEGYLLKQNEDGLTYRPVVDYRNAYADRYHETRNLPFQNPLLNELGTPKQKEIWEKPNEFAAKLPDRVSVEVKNANEATARAQAKKSVAEKISLAVQKAVGIDPPDPKFKLIVSDDFFPPDSVTYEAAQKIARAELNLAEALKERAIREFMMQNGLPPPAGKPEYLATTAYRIKTAGANPTEATTKAKEELLRQLTADMRRVVGGSSALLESDIPGGIPVTTDGNKAIITLDFDLAQRQTLVENYQKHETVAGMVLIVSEERDPDRVTAEAIVKITALIDLSQSIRDALEDRIPIGATENDLAETDVAGLLPAIEITGSAPFVAKIDLNKMSPEQRRAAMEKYMTKNSLPPEVMLPPKEKPPLSERLSFVKQYATYENPANLIDAGSIMRDAQNADETIARRTAQASVIQGLTRQVCDRLGVSQAEYPFTLADFQTNPPFDINTYTTYDTGTHKAFVTIRRPIAPELRAAFARAYLDHHGFSAGVFARPADRPDWTHPVRFNSGTTIEDALAQFPDTPTAGGVEYGTHAFLFSIQHAGEAAYPDIPLEEKTAFQEAFDKRKAKFKGGVDVRSPQNYPAWYRLVQEWRDGTSPGDVGKNLVRRMLLPMSDTIGKDIKNKFKGTGLAMDTVFTGQLDRLTYDIRAGEFKQNPEIIVVLAEGNLSARTADIQKQAKEVIDSYFPAQAEEVARILATH